MMSLNLSGEHFPLDVVEIIDSLALLLAITGALVFWHKRRRSHDWPSTNDTVEYGLTSDLDGWRANLVYFLLC